MSLQKWDRRFLDMAQHIAGWSKDESTKVGAVIVGPDREIRSTGYNGMPPGVDEGVEARLQRPEKYLWFEHAERNAIYFAALNGVALRGCTIYVVALPALTPCSDCARGIIRSGIKRVVMTVPEVTPERWLANMNAARLMLKEAGVELLEVTP
jgi:dCMP deaminase